MHRHGVHRHGTPEKLCVRSSRAVTLRLCLALLLTIAALAAGITAYLLYVDNMENEIAIGGCNVEIVENFVPPKELHQSTEITKDVKVKNKGPNDCFVRARAVFADSDMEKICTVDWKTTETDVNNKWVHNPADDYYYYSDLLMADELTDSLMTKVTINSGVSDDQIKDFDIIIYVEAYQAFDAENNANFSSYTDAWEQFEANKTSAGGGT